MKWNTHQDMENRAYAGILTTLFPEQTKTLPRILTWSLIFLADLILGLVAAMHLGLLSAASKLSAALLIAAIVGIFWLQGFVWYKIVGFFQSRTRIEP